MAALVAFGGLGSADDILRPAGDGTLPWAASVRSIPVPPWLLDVDNSREKRPDDRGMLEALAVYPSSSVDEQTPTIVQLIARQPHDAKPSRIRFREVKRLD